jgi:hypothetical protein
LLAACAGAGGLLAMEAEEAAAARHAGRGARESTDYEHAPFVNRFVDSVLRHPDFHVTGPQLGYRNRMT